MPCSISQTWSRQTSDSSPPRHPRSRFADFSLATIHFGRLAVALHENHCLPPRLQLQVLQLLPSESQMPIGESREHQLKKLRKRVIAIYSRFNEDALAERVSGIRWTPHLPNSVVTNFIGLYEVVEKKQSSKARISL